MQLIPTNQLSKFHHGLCSRFSSNLGSKTSFYNLERELNCACLLFKCKLMWHHESCAQKQVSRKLELFYQLFINLLCHILLVVGFNTRFNSAVWNCRYIHQSGLMQFKCLSCSCFFWGLLLLFLQAWLKMTSDRKL